MGSPLQCESCGAPMPGTGEAELCPACALGLALGDGDGAPPAEAEHAGQSIDRYQLVEMIGKGGFGFVYRARQSEPVRREVALKLMKPGMDSYELIRRFQIERQALALMDHPHVAKVHDAGATREGRPYFVMELVDGIPVTVYANRHRMTVVQRLEMFIEICEAVQHAHQKGIIHRDLKPSNILVSTGEDGRPFPKIIDFGVAKAIGDELTDESLVTDSNRLIGTLEYMGPEQADITTTDIDTRSDIYALGAILYELLTGETPLDGKVLASSGYEAMRRMIREQVPRRPSARIRTMDADRLLKVAQQRGTEGAKLRRQLHRDLDWIVMRALEKERNLRYNTAHGLALEIGRYLTGQPVEAGPPGTLYRVHKFVSRNRTAVITSALVVAALIAGIIVSWVNYARAKEDEEIANDALREAREARIAAETAQAKAEETERARRASHRDALVRLATVERLIGKSGGRRAALDALEEAAGIEPAPDQDPIDLRNEAIACLAWVDVQESPAFLPEGQQWAAVFDADHARCALISEPGGAQLVQIPQDPEGPVQVGLLPALDPREEPLGFSPYDGRYLVTVRDSGGTRRVRITDRQSGEFRDDREPLQGEGIEILPDDSGLAVARPGGRVELLDWNARAFAGFEAPGEIVALSYSPKTGCLAVASRLPEDQAGVSLIGDDGIVGTHSTRVGEPPTALKWNPGGRFLAVGEQNGAVWVLDPVNPVGGGFRTAGHHAPVTRIAWSPDGSMFATGCDAGEIRPGEVRLWDGRQGTLFCLHEAQAGRLTFSRSGNSLGPISRQGKTRRLRVVQSKVCHRGIGHPDTPGIVAAAWSSPDPRSGPLHWSHVLTTAASDGIRLWNRRAREIGFLPVAGTRGLAYARTQLLVSGTSGVRSRSFGVVMTEGGPKALLGPERPLATIEGCEGIAVSERHGVVAVASRSGVHLVGLAGPHATECLPGSATRRFTEVAISEDQKWLAASNASDPESPGVYLWELEKRRPLGRLLTAGPARIAFSPIGLAPDGELPGFLMVCDTEHYQSYRYDAGAADWIPGKGFSNGSEGRGRPGRAVYSPRRTALAVSHKGSQLSVRFPVSLGEMTQPNFDQQWPLAISPDGILMANEGFGGRLFLWNLVQIREELAQLDLDWRIRPFASIPQAVQGLILRLEGSLDRCLEPFPWIPERMLRRLSGLADLVEMPVVQELEIRESP